MAFGSTPIPYGDLVVVALAGRYICADHSVERHADPQHRLSQEFRMLLAELNVAAGLQPARSRQPQSSGLISRGISRMATPVSRPLSVNSAHHAPPDWSRRIAVTRAWGDRWLREGQGALLVVRSVLVPETYNILIWLVRRV